MKTTPYNIRYILIVEHKTLATVHKDAAIYSAIRPGGKATRVRKLSRTAGTLTIALISGKPATPTERQCESLFCLLAALCEQHPKAKVMGLHPALEALPDSPLLMGVYDQTVFLELLRKTLKRRWL